MADRAIVGGATQPADGESRPVSALSAHRAKSRLARDAGGDRWHDWSVRELEDKGAERL